MKHFNIYKPPAKGKLPAITIADLIPEGRDNAIKRRDLLFLCFDAGLVERPKDTDNENDMMNADRAMRKLIEKARIDYVILNLSRGKGYYKPTHEDMLELQRYIRQEDKRAKAAFKNHSMARALYEDYKHGRLEEVT